MNLIFRAEYRGTGPVCTLYLVTLLYALFLLPIAQVDISSTTTANATLKVVVSCLVTIASALDEGIE